MEESRDFMNRMNEQKEEEDIDEFYYEGGQLLASPSAGEEIVISGLSGIFPNSTNVREFSKNLFNKVNMMTDNKNWKHIHSGISSTFGMIPDVNRHDCGFFGIHDRQSNSMHSLARIFQERAVEAIFDAGLHLSELEGTKTGVFVGISSSEFDKILINDTNLRKQMFALTGTERSMIANRLSYFLKVKGPSYVVDTACSSSIFALEDAYRAIRVGEVDRAIVGGVNLCLHPLTTLQFVRMNIVTKDGTCKPFDIEGQGFVRSEAAVVLILQKFKDARRTYAQIVHVKTNCDGFKEQGITHPSGMEQRKLLVDTHDDCGVDRTNLVYMEAHGTGTKIGDPIECQAIDSVLTSGRKTPLLLGSVKSNMGHSEAASGLCSITKCILAMETGYIPPNINFSRPRKEIAEILEERIKIVTDVTPLQDDDCFIGINNFGFGGTNAYVILKRNSKKNVTIPDGLPRLGVVSGRTKEGVDILLKEIVHNAMDHEYIGLLHEVFKKNIPNHLYRGYSIVSNCGALLNSTALCPKEVQPLYFALGELKNWHSIGKQLMELPLFSNAMGRLVEQSSSFDITDVLVHDKDSTSKIGSVVVQLALVDVLNILGIKPRDSIGSLEGILVSAYCNGILTLSETLKSAIVLDKITPDDEELQHSSVFKKDINGNEDVTMQKKSLKFSNSRTMRESLNNSLTGKPADYLLNALASTGYNDIKNIEMNSIILEISDTSLGDLEDISVISLFSNGQKNYILGFFEGLGRLYLKGYNPQISKLYPRVEFPVSRGTPMISPSIRWNHLRKKFVPLYDLDLIHRKENGIKKFKIQLNNEKWSFISGHVVDIDRNIFPISGYIYLVWETFALMNGTTLDTTRVSLKKCQVLRTSTVASEGTITFVVLINKRTGDFKVTEDISTVMTGRISLLSNSQQNIKCFESTALGELHDSYLNKEDVYKELRLRGLNYSGKFRAIEKYDSKNFMGLIKWQENWITFIDNLIQMKILQYDTRLLSLPVFISEVEIDVFSHQAIIKENEISSSLFACNSACTGKIHCGGVTISEIKMVPLARKKRQWKPLLQSYEFVPNFTELETHISVRVNVQIILEDTLARKFKVVELVDEFSEKNAELLAPLVNRALKDEPLVQFSGKILSKEKFDVDIEVENKSLHEEANCELVIVSKVLERPETLKVALEVLKDDGFVISRETYQCDVSRYVSKDISIITVHKTSSETLLLLKKASTQKPRCYVNIESSETFSWLLELQKAVKKASKENIVLYSEKDSTNGILGTLTCLRKEPNKKNIRCIFIMDENKHFDPNCCTIKDQLKKNMAFNVYKDGRWGTYRHLALEKLGREESEHCVLNLVESGDGTSVIWTEGPLRHSMTTEVGQELVYIYYSSLHFNGTMGVNKKMTTDTVTSSRLEIDSTLGCEFSGIDRKGNRVMGISPKETLSNLTLTDPLFVYEVPHSWSLEEAATVPISYIFAIYALVIRGHMKAGESLLILADDGGMKEAAIRVAYHYGCDVLTTTTMQEECEYFTKIYPKLNGNILNVSEKNLDKMVLQETNGKGVDLILNSFSKNQVEPLVRCLSKGGQLLNLGVENKTQMNVFNLSILQKDVSIHNVGLGGLFKETLTVKSQVRRIFQELMQSGVVAPLIRKVFDYNEVERAFKYVVDEDCTEKVLIKIREPESQPAIVPKTQKLQVAMRYYCDPKGVYIVVGGLGGLGMELADWLVLRGCKKLILTSRNGITTGYQNYRISLWKSYGIKVKISINPLITKEGCIQLIEETENLGPIMAIFNLAVVLIDGSLENQTEESFAKCLAPKVTVTKHLDELTRKMCPQLRDFVVFSSVCCGWGNAEQSNYGMANSVMERICEKRKKEGYPGLAIQWGMVGEVGIVSELKKDRSSDAIAGYLQQPVASCLEVLDVLLRQNKSPVVTSMIVAEKQRPQSTNNVVDAITSIIGLKDLKYVSVNSTLPELGMDSMLAREIKQVLENEFKIMVDICDLRSMTIKRLKDFEEEIDK